MRAGPIVLLGPEKGVYRLGFTIVDGADVASAKAVSMPSSTSNIVPGWTVAFQLDPAGTEAFAKATNQAFQAGQEGDTIHSRIAIVVGARVISAPTVMATITTGSGEITGNFSATQARALAAALSRSSASASG